MNLTTTYDHSHLEAVKASRKALAAALATLETIDQGSATAAERLANVTGKLRQRRYDDHHHRTARRQGWG
jgi:hypothetical protein